jgi:hypothetical protein
MTMRTLGYAELDQRQPHAVNQTWPQRDPAASPLSGKRLTCRQHQYRSPRKHVPLISTARPAQHLTNPLPRANRLTLAVRDRGGSDDPAVMVMALVAPGPVPT